MAAESRTTSEHALADPGAPNGSNGAGNKIAARLDSWKDIAGYFQRDIRTVQLWEKKEALPVHRHEHGGRSSVYAYAEELDAWLHTRDRGREADPEGQPEADQISPSRPRAVVWWITTAILFAGTAGFIWIRHEMHPQPRPPATSMLVVLPFTNLTQAPSPAATDFLADGLTDDLITDLGRSRQITVMGSRTTMRLRGRHDPVREIAEQLHAGLILDGSVAQQGETVRVTAQLLDATSDRQLWAGSYSRAQADVMMLQDEIAAEIAGDVIETLTGSRSRMQVALRPVNPQARIDTLTGHYLWEQRDEADMRRAIGYFHQAIALDSGYAPAWVGLADSYDLMAVWGKMPSAQAFPEARSSAEMALSLDPNSAEAYNSLAFEVYRYEWDFAGADEDFRKAIALNPDYSVAHQWYGEFLGDLRRFDESIAELRRAKDLDPLSAIVGSDLADGYFHAGRYAEAEAELRRILALYPKFAPAHSYLATVCAAEGHSDCAEKELQTYAELSGDSLSVKIFQLHREALAGQTNEAREALNSLLQTRAGRELLPYQKAQLYFDVEETDEGYAELETAFQQRSWWLVTLMVDPGFEKERSQPRFVALERRVGLPVDAPAR